MYKPSSLAHKKWGFFASVMIKIGGNFLFWLSSGVMLHFKGQVSYVEGDLAFTERWVGQNLLTPVVFAYRNHDSGPHAVTLILFQIAYKQSDLSFSISNPNQKLYCKI